VSHRGSNITNRRPSRLRSSRGTGARRGFHPPNRKVYTVDSDFQQENREENFTAGNRRPAPTLPPMCVLLYRQNDRALAQATAWRRRAKSTQCTTPMRNERSLPQGGASRRPWTRRLRASRSIPSVLFSSFNRSQPSLAATQPKFVGREQTRRCVIERTCADFDLASSIHDAVK
jgi:hypothetical protein